MKQEEFERPEGLQGVAMPCRDLKGKVDNAMQGFKRKRKRSGWREKPHSKLWE